MVKKKLNILFFILLSVLFLGSSCTSYAMSKSEAFEYCRDNCGLSSLFNAPSENNGNNLLSYNNFLTYLDNQTNNYMFVRKTSTATSNTEFDILFFDTFSINGNNYSGKVNNNRSGSRKSCYSFNNYYNTSAFTQSSSSTSDGTFPTAANTFYMVYGNGEIIAASFDLPITSRFIPDFDYHVTVNNITNVNCMLRNWSINQWYLGQTEDYSTLYAFHMFLYDLDANVELGHVYAYRETNSISGGNALYFQEGNLYANSRYMRHNVLYRLYIEKWLDGVQSNEEYYFIFLPRNAVVSNGQIVSVGSGDFNVQDSTNNIIASQESGDDKIIAALTSSYITSGEEPTLEDLSVPEVQDTTEDFFTWLMNSVLDILYNNNDSTLEVPLYNTTHYIRSDVYKFNIEPLKTFIQAAWWFIVGVPVLKYIRRSIERLKGGELPATDDKSDLLGNIL